MASSKEAASQNGEQAASKVKLEGDALKDAIKKQVEYYFSRENLSQDPFLVSKMDSQHYVDVAVIAAFKMVKQLTSDTDLILACVAGSDKVIVDAANKKIKPTVVNARTTLILRNIPTDAPEADVRALMAGDKWPKVTSLRSDVGDNWFASFDTEEQTKTALELARGLKYKDKAISCAIKSENLLKGLQPGSPPKGAPTNGMYGGWNGAYAPGGYAPNGWNGGGAYAGAEGGFGRGGRGAPVTRGGRAGPGGAVATSTGNGVPAAEEGGARNSGSGNNKRNKPKAREGRDQQTSSPSTEKKVEQAPINLNDFPSLAGSAPVVGAYSKPKDMISIFKDAKGGEKEDGKREGSEDASQNKAHDANNGTCSSSEASNKGANGPAPTGGASKDASPSADAASAAPGAPDAKSATPLMNGASPATSSAPKKMSWAAAASAKPAPSAAPVST